MKESNQEKLSQLFTKIASQTILDSSTRSQIKTVRTVKSYSISEISLQQLSAKRKHPWRWQSKLLYLDRVVGNNEAEAIGKQSL